MNDQKGNRRCKLYFVSGSIALFLAWCYLITRPVPPPKEEEWPSWSPDGRQVAYECYVAGPHEGGGFFSSLNRGGGPFFTAEAADLCITDLDRHKRVHLISEEGGDWRPSWSPDGTQIAYLRADGIYLISSKGKDSRRLVQIESPLYKLNWEMGEAVVNNWSPEGDVLLFSGCLEHRDHDVYIVDVETGALTNLTPDSRAEDFAPGWTLDGSKISFLSADSSSAYGCGPNEEALPQMKVMNADGTDERVVYDPEFYYPYWQVSVSNSGKIAFLSDMTSRTYEEYYVDRGVDGGLYVLDLTTNQLVKVSDVRGVWDRIPIWSPDGQQLAYYNGSGLSVVDVRTGERIVRGNLRVDSGSIEGRYFWWSPDNQQLAATVSIDRGYEWLTEEHVLIFDTQSGEFQPLVQEQSSSTWWKESIP